MFSYSSGGQKSELGSTGLLSRCQQSHARPPSPQQSLRGESISLPFPASGAAYISRLVPSCLPPASKHGALSLTPLLFTSVTLPSPLHVRSTLPPSYRDPWQSCLKVQPDNPGWPCLLKFLAVITSKVHPGGLFLMVQ